MPLTNDSRYIRIAAETSDTVLPPSPTYLPVDILAQETDGVVTRRHDLLLAGSGGALSRTRELMGLEYFARLAMPLITANAGDMLGWAVDRDASTEELTSLSIEQSDGDVAAQRLSGCRIRRCQLTAVGGKSIRLAVDMTGQTRSTISSFTTTPDAADAYTTAASVVLINGTAIDGGALYTSLTIENLLQAGPYREHGTEITDLVTGPALFELTVHAGYAAAAYLNDLTGADTHTARWILGTARTVTTGTWSGTTIPVANGSLFAAGDIVRVVAGSGSACTRTVTGSSATTVTVSSAPAEAMPTGSHVVRSGVDIVMPSVSCGAAELSPTPDNMLVWRLSWRHDAGDGAAALSVDSSAVS